MEKNKHLMMDSKSLEDHDNVKVKENRNKAFRCSTVKPDRNEFPQTRM